MLLSLRVREGQFDLLLSERRELSVFLRTQSKTNLRDGRTWWMATNARCAKLNASLFGRQDAQRKREDKYSHELENMGSREAVPIHVHTGARDGRLAVQGDDFFLAGPDHQVSKFVSAMQSIFEVKVTIIRSQGRQGEGALSVD